MIPATTPFPRTSAARPLKGVRILSLALNLPGPAALQRCRALGARCAKVEPPAGDPMQTYSGSAYAALQQGVPVRRLDLKTPAGLAALHRRLATSDVLLVSFRPSALKKLGLDWATLRAAHPALSVVEIVGGEGDAAEHPGHDLTYQAAAGLLRGTDLPSSLLADMAGAQLATEAVLSAVLEQRQRQRGVHRRVSLEAAAHWLAQPVQWGLMGPDSDIGGAHAGYALYPCADGRVALAALEPHFAQRLCSAIGRPWVSLDQMRSAETRQAIARFFKKRASAEIDALARAHDLPLHTLPYATPT